MATKCRRVLCVANRLWLLFCLFTLASNFIVLSESAVINVVRFGARPDGRTDSTLGFYRAWTWACKTRQSTVIYVPRGRFLVHPITMEGPCRSRAVAFRISGTIVAPMDYWSWNSKYWILFRKVSRLGIYGGTFDGRGRGFWACRMRKGKQCPTGAGSVSFEWSTNIVLQGVTSRDSHRTHINVNHCRNVRIQQARIYAPSWSPNTDGIHVQFSSQVVISRTAIMTGDDCISIGPGSRRLRIDRIACGPGHGISIGSLAKDRDEDGVEDVSVTGAVFTGTLNGVRIKSWGRPTTSYVRRISFRNIIVRYVANPIIIDQRYCPDRNCYHQASGVRISDVTFKNIKGTSRKLVSMSFVCSSKYHCRNIRLQDIRLTYGLRGSSPSVAYCRNAHGSARGVVVPKSCL